MEMLENRASDQESELVSQPEKSEPYVQEEEPSEPPVKPQPI